MEKSILKDIGLYKDKLVSVFLGSPDICRTLLGESYTDSDVSNLMYKQIFPLLCLNENETAVLPFILFDVDVKEIPTSTVKHMAIIIEPCCHQDCMKYSQDGYSGTRVDILADMIERELRRSDSFGIGCLHLDSVTHKSYHGTYYGRQMVFSVPDFKLKG